MSDNKQIKKKKSKKTKKSKKSKGEAKKRSIEEVSESKSKKKMKTETTNNSDENEMLYLGNLSVDLTEEKCRAFFESCGNIINVIFFKKKDRWFLGNGYIIFSTGSEADKAFLKNGKSLLGKAIIIRKLGSRKTKSIRLSNLSWEVTDSAVRLFFAQCGEVLDLYLLKKNGKPTGHAWITFRTQEEADQAIAKNDNEILGRNIVARYSLYHSSSAEVHITNLSKEVNVEKIKAFFADVGPITIVRPMVHTKTQVMYAAVVKFKDPECVHDAVEKTGTMLEGVVVRVVYGSPPREKPIGCKTIFIDHMPTHVSRNQVRIFFEGCGSISDIRLLKGRYTGAGFVDFEDTETVEKAMEKNATDFLGQPININYAKGKNNKNTLEHKDTKNIFVANLHAEVDEDMLRSFFGDCGVIDSIRLKIYDKGQVAFVDFKESGAAVNNALKKNGKSLLNRDIRVELGKKRLDRRARPEDCKSVFVAGLTDVISEAKLKNLFADCGPINKVRMINGKNIAFIYFESIKATEKAKEKTGTVLDGCKVRVEYNNSKRAQSKKRKIQRN